ncbi:Kinase domain containing protein [Ceratobasidium theobromae]|uniref:Kinase domain containing protein n=1 Tax=Ceratobasidium theobromae TaxID=1582974 RepID=A0A5N5QFM2_9AGAM|nr:Kinase domain containing protein [Ceratobasidium theobromae]
MSKLLGVLNFVKLEKAIRETYQQERYRSLAGHLILFKFNKPSEEYENAKFSKAMALNLTHKVGSASGWPAGSDFDDSLIHIVAGVKEPVPRAIKRGTVEPSDRDGERVKKRKRERDDYLETLDEFTASQAAIFDIFPKLQKSRTACIHNRRPAGQTGPSIVLYHQVFGRFLKRLQSADPLPDTTYSQTTDYFPLSQNLYDDEAERRQKIKEDLGLLLGEVLVVSSAHGVQADGSTLGRGGASCIIMEMENEIGSGNSDPSVQAAQSYARWWKDKALLKKCCCPSILIAIAGPWMCILGAVYLERLIVQPLTDFMWVGFNPAKPLDLDRVARAFHCACLARDELEKFYENPPGRIGDSQQYFPYIRSYTDSTGTQVHFEYKDILEDVGFGGSIYRAQTCQNPPRLIVVKFVERYNSEAHKLLAEAGLAPGLLYDGTVYPDDQPGPDHTMIVMEYIEGVNLARYNDFPVPDCVRKNVDDALKLLHKHDFVFGDLRDQNVIVVQDAAKVVTGAMLIDFDWCGKELEARYPCSMNTQIKWPNGVGPGKFMEKYHDEVMWKRLRLNR